MNLWGIGAIIAALCLLIFGVNKWETKIEQRGYDRAAAVYATAALKDEEKQRAIEQERHQKQSEAVNVAQLETQDAIDAGAQSAAAVISLRKQLAADRDKRYASDDPRVAAERAAADKIGEFFGSCVQEYSQMASDADKARIAGKLCERYYDALRPSIRTQVESMRKGKP